MIFTKIWETFRVMLLVLPILEHYSLLGLRQLQRRSGAVGGQLPAGAVLWGGGGLGDVAWSNWRLDRLGFGGVIGVNNLVTQVDIPSISQ